MEVLRMRAHTLVSSVSGRPINGFTNGSLITCLTNITCCESRKFQSVVETKSIYIGVVLKYSLHVSFLYRFKIYSEFKPLCLPASYKNPSGLFVMTN